MNAPAPDPTCHLGSDASLVPRKRMKCLKPVKAAHARSATSRYQPLLRPWVMLTVNWTATVQNQIESTRKRIGCGRHRANADAANNAKPSRKPNKSKCGPLPSRAGEMTVINEPTTQKKAQTETQA